MSVLKHRRRALDVLNMTPMIDVVFLLLIFFLVATRLDEEEQQLQVVLPQASEAKPLVSQPEELFVSVDGEGRFFIGDRRLATGELNQMLRQAAADNPGRQSVVIRADKECVWEHVVQVMNLCNQAGINDYRVAAWSGG